MDSISGQQERDKLYTEWCGVNTVLLKLSRQTEITKSKLRSAEILLEVWLRKKAEEDASVSETEEEDTIDEAALRENISKNHTEINFLREKINFLQSFSQRKVAECDAKYTAVDINDDAFLSVYSMNPN